MPVSWQIGVDWARDSSTFFITVSSAPRAAEPGVGGGGRQRGGDRVSSVQFLKFNTGGQVPIAVGVDLPALRAETKLTGEQRAALKADLAH